MIVNRFKEEDLEKVINQNKKVIIGICDENSVLSDLFEGMMRKIMRKLSDETIVCIIESQDYSNECNETNILPVIISYIDGKKTSELYGFRNYNYFIEKLVI